MTIQRTGNEYLAWLHRHRRETWEEAQRRGLSFEEFVREIDARGSAAWAEMKQRQVSPKEQGK